MSRPDTAPGPAGPPRRPPPPRPLLSALRPAAGPAGPAVRPVVAVHPGALPASAWADLADRLPEDTAPYLCDLGTVTEYVTAALDPAAPVIGVRELAARCLAELTAAGLTERPFALVGWSFGGVVGYEIAARLDAEGRAGTLRELVVLDSIAPVAAFQRPDDALEPAMLLDWFAAGTAWSPAPPPPGTWTPCSTRPWRRACCPPGPNRPGCASCTPPSTPDSSATTAAPPGICPPRSTGPSPSSNRSARCCPPAPTSAGAS